MAVIRCQSCGKPNPDFLEVCQYCDARLKPLEGGPAPEPAAPPAEQPGMVRCPACGKLNPNFLEVCQFCDARLVPLGAAPPLEAAPPLADKPGIVRCPACGKPNPAIADVCQYCDARLKPLAAGEPKAAPTLDTLDRLRAIVPPSEPEPETFAPAPQQAEPDWMWTGAPAEDADAAKPAVEDVRSAAPGTPAADDWMSALRGAAAQPAPAEEVPDWMKPALSAAEGPAPEEAPAAAPAEEIPDWLKSMREEAAPSAPQPAPAEEIPDWLRSPGTEAAPPASAAAPSGEIPDWLKSMRAEAAPPEPEAAPAREAEIPDWLKAARAEEPAPPEPAAPPAGEVPDWLKGAEAAPPTPAISAFTPEPAAPAPEAEIPDWLKPALSTAEGPMQPAEAGPAQPAESVFAPEPAEAEPDWLQSLRGAETTVPPVEPASEAAPEAGREEPDWLQSLRGLETTAPPEEPAGAVPTEGGPDWLQALGETGAGTGGTGPAVSPFAAEEFVSPFTDQPPETPTLDTTTGPMPDWLAAMRPGDLSDALADIKPEPSAPARQPRAALVGAGIEGLEQTALPTWLEAMRPVEVGEAQLPAETDTYQESVGLLAGMRGILRAEPAVAIPHKSTTQVPQLEVSAVHASQAELLARLLAEESEARPEVKRRAQLVQPLERWLVFALMAVALLLPFALGSGLFPAPATIGLDTQAAYNVVETLPAPPLAQPALVAFDYDPAQAGELSPAATALVAHLMHRGVPVVGVSTRLAGAAVGDDLLNQVAADLQTSHGLSYTYGTQYLNLGYIPGGPVGLLQFAAAPRRLFQRDFAGSSEVWTTPLMTPVSRLSDFSLIVLITATPDSARAWVEQTRNYAQGVKMLAVVSAGADPLVRPYYEADPPQIAGMVSGLRGAAQYEKQAGLPGAASERWDMFGSGLLAAAVIILVGNLINIGTGLVRRRKKR